ncbi:hypothetical protein HLB23_29540 [Nocardia uniformis]|uniref:Uncharacterized protein n=1 Tax=Nocardia uniformis TaxID=53432 RepID=A0A849CEU0_9NOCA|nr:hypothetical protein [Nocardia uniformis]NNH73949.1 hypothetical protein [Nocardia uniformis]
MAMIKHHNRIGGVVAKPVREKARGPELGHQRLDRYTAAYDWAVKCIDTCHYLEAIAVLDSLLGDRLSSRYTHILRAESIVPVAVGEVCKRLLNGDPKLAAPQVESDPRFRVVIDEIWEWARTRNRAMHQAAKILRNGDPRVAFLDILEEHRQTALDGVALLRKFDELDTQIRQERGKVPGTYPNAFFPENRIRRSSM